MAQLIAPRKPAPRATPRREVPTIPIVLSAVAVLAIAGIVLLFVVVPIVLKQRCIALAADHGVTLAVDHVAVGPGEVRLIKVAFSFEGVPQISGAADDVRVTLSGLTPADSNADGLALTMDGPLEDLQKSFATWSAAQAHRATALAAGPSTARPVSWSLGHVTWTRAFGQSARVELANVSGEVDPVKRTTRLSSDHATITSGASVFGPWRLSLDRDPTTARVDVELDPVVQGGPSIVFVHDASDAISVRANVPLSPVAHLGVPAKTPGLGPDSTLETTIDFEENRSGTSTLKADVTLGRALFGGVPLDAKVDLTASGSVAKGLDVKQGTFTAGPLHGSVTGTMQIFDDGARLALAWKSQGIPCSDIGKQMATQALGQLGSQLGSIAGDVGNVIGLRVAGEASASGLVTVDSRDLASTTFTMTSNQTCGVALF